MPLQKREKDKKVSATILIASLVSALGAAQSNIIINKSVISPGSIVTGNTGVVIDGKRVERGTIKKFDYHKVELSPIHTAKIELDSVALIIEDGSSLTIAKGLPYTIKHNRLHIVDRSEKFAGSRVTIASNSLDGAVVEGDCAIKLLKPLTFLQIRGDSTIDIEAPQESLDLNLQGDSTIHIRAHVAKLTIHFHGDLVIDAKDIDRLSLHGSGDVILNIPKETKLTTKIEGDIEIRRHND